MDAFVKRLPKPQGEVKHSRAKSSHEQDKERPSKRSKKDEVQDSGSDHSDDYELGNHEDLKPATRSNSEHDDDEQDEPDDGTKPITEFESALPPTKVDKKAIEDYEAMKSSQMSASDDGKTEQASPAWVRGRSSIYVDAFTLALDTVLEDESHLFDHREMEVFRQWRELGYEAQYLYVMERSSRTLDL